MNNVVLDSKGKLDKTRSTVVKGAASMEKGSKATSVASNTRDTGNRIHFVEQD